MPISSRKREAVHLHASAAASRINRAADADLKLGGGELAVRDRGARAS